VRGLGDKFPLAPLLVRLHVLMSEGWLQGGDDRLRQSPDEAELGRQLYPILLDQLEQRLTQGVVLPEQRPRVRAASVHR
jgi:hypothetical protein